MSYRKKVYKRTKHRFTMEIRDRNMRFFGRRGMSIIDKARIETLAGRLQPLRIRTVRMSEDRSNEKVFTWLSRLKKHTKSLQIFMSMRPGYVKMYQTKRPRYYRGKPHTIEGYEMQLDYEERQKLIDKDNHEAMSAMYYRIKALESALDSVLQETNTGDEVFEITEARIPTTTLTEAKEVLKDVGWNPWSDKPTNYPSIKSQKVGKDGTVSITVTMSTGGVSEA